MAKNYKVQSTGGRFKKRNASDGSGAIRSQANIVTDSLKLQREQASRIASQQIQSIEGIGRNEEWNQNLLDQLEDKAYQNKRDAIKIRNKTEIDNLLVKAEEYEKKAQFWGDFSSTYAKQYANAAQKTTDAIQKFTANQLYDKLDAEEELQALATLDTLDHSALKLFLKQSDENSNDLKGLNTLSKLFSGNNRFYRAKILQDTKELLPQYIEVIEDFAKNNNQKWLPEFIPTYYRDFAKSLISQYDLGNSKEGSELLKLFSKYGNLKARYVSNVRDVEFDRQNIVTAVAGFKAVMDKGEGSIEYTSSLQALYNSVYSAKRRSGDKFKTGFDTPMEALYAMSQELAPHISDSQTFEDIVMSTPTPGKYTVTFNKRYGNEDKNADIRANLSKIYKNAWDDRIKVLKSEHIADDNRRLLTVQEWVGEGDITTVEGQQELATLAIEHAGYSNTVEFINKAQLFNFGSKNGIWINDDLLKAKNEGDLDRMNSIVPFLPKSLKNDWIETMEDLAALNSTGYDAKKIDTLAADRIQDITGSEGLKPKSNTNGLAKDAWKSVFYSHFYSTRGAGTALARADKAAQFANVTAGQNSGAFRRGKLSTGRIEWLAFVDEKTDPNDRSKDYKFGEGDTTDELQARLKRYPDGVMGLIKDPNLGKRNNRGIGTDKGFNPMPLDYYDAVQKAMLNNRAIPVHEHLKIIRRQMSPELKKKYSLTDLLNIFMYAGTQTEVTDKSKPPIEASFRSLPPGQLDRLEWEVETSKVNFPNYHSMSTQDQIALGVYATVFKDTNKTLMSKQLEDIFTESVSKKIDPIVLVEHIPISPQQVFKYTPKQGNKQ